MLKLALKYRAEEASDASKCERKSWSYLASTISSLISLSGSHSHPELTASFLLQSLSKFAHSRHCDCSSKKLALWGLYHPRKFAIATFIELYVAMHAKLSLALPEP